MGELHYEIPRESGWEAQERKLRLEEERLRSVSVPSFEKEPGAFEVDKEVEKDKVQPRIVRVELTFDDGVTGILEGEEANRWWKAITGSPCEGWVHASRFPREFHWQTKPAPTPEP